MAEEKEKNKKVRRASAKKRDLQNEKNRLHNKAFRSKVKTSICNYEESLIKKDIANIEKSLSDLFSLLDKGAKLGIFKQNKTDRLKSRAVAKRKST